MENRGGANALRLKGKIFGRLRVLRRHGRNKENRSLWMCSCICGNITVTTGTRLKSGRVKSCGCLLKELNSQRLKKTSIRIVHGFANKIPEYRSWISMRARCSDSKRPTFKYYGGRGIKVCKRWLDSFKNFLDDMGRKPGPKYTLDRIDVNGNYEPNNCKWSTKKEQVANRRKSARIELFTDEELISELAIRGIKCSITG